MSEQEIEAPSQSIPSGGSIIKLWVVLLLSMAAVSFLYALSIPFRLLFPKMWRDQVEKAERKVIMNNLNELRN
jgi:hypothetical protein